MHAAQLYVSNECLFPLLALLSICCVRSVTGNGVDSLLETLNRTPR
jgi:hypothetical protein